MTAEEKAQIDGMTQLELCRTWRFAECPYHLLQGETGQYFAERLKEMGGFTPEISKQLGFERT